MQSTNLPDPNWLSAILQTIEAHPTGSVLLILLVAAVSYAVTCAVRVFRD